MRYLFQGGLPSQTMHRLGDHSRVRPLVTATARSATEAPDHRYGGTISAASGVRPARLYLQADTVTVSPGISLPSGRAGVTAVVATPLTASDTHSHSRKVRARHDDMRR